MVYSWSSDFGWCISGYEVFWRGLVESGSGDGEGVKLVDVKGDLGSEEIEDGKII